MTFREYCKQKYAQADDSISVDEYEVLMKVIENSADGDKYRDLMRRIWHEWYTYYPDQRRYQAALDKMYLKYITRENL